ncbi:hypothetical protein ACHHYP_03190 [Achlya hypogyna]|uniref:Uncharacterized protein n=1 Tax=Achlya hypogyna TaxID=1202772 RepID=A0A1V9Z477_ACHHY|nr:hypothetical protein ACHHYP_03190 [Achlya hypogyna]
MEKEAALQAHRDQLRRAERNAKLKQALEDKASKAAEDKAFKASEETTPKEVEAPRRAKPAAVDVFDAVVDNNTHRKHHSAPVALRDLDQAHIDLRGDFQADALLGASLHGRATVNRGNAAELKAVETLRMMPPAILLQLPPTPERDAGAPRHVHLQYRLRKGLSYETGPPPLRRRELDEVLRHRAKGRRRVEPAVVEPRKVDVERQLRQVKSCLRSSIAAKGSKSESELPAPSRLEVLRSSVSSSLLEAMLASRTSFNAPKLLKR